MINHVVFIKPRTGESGLLMDDYDRLLPNIPGSADTGVVNTGSMGGQPSTRIMMSVCMSDSIPEDYATYVDHAKHIELVERWKQNPMTVSTTS